MRKILRYIYLSAGIACIAYYFVFSLASRFGLSLGWIWPFFGAIFLACAFLCEKNVPPVLRLAWRSLMLIGLIWLMVLEGFVLTGMTQSAPENMDYIIVLGARVEKDGPSPALTRRLNAAAEYLEDSPDTLVIASGGQGSDEPMSEAECIRNELVARGIEPGRILLEDKSTDTMQNIAFSMELIDDHRASVGIITNNFHVYRAEKLARAAGLENACGIAAKYTGYTLFHYMFREAVCITVEFLRGNFRPWIACN